jgi:hypothetical protein
LGALVRAVYQSIAAKAAEAIYHRLEEKLGGKLRPVKIVALTSRQIDARSDCPPRTRTISEVAAWFVTNRRSARQLPTMSNEDVVTTLILGETKSHAMNRIQSVEETALNGDADRVRTIVGLEFCQDVLDT